MPPTPEACEDAGVLGPVPGLLGTWAAIEALKVLLHADPLPVLLLFDALAAAPVATFPLRRRKRCACAAGPGVADCGAGAPALAACAVPRVAVPRVRLRDLGALRAPRLLDVRPREHFAFSHLEGSVNAPFAELPAEAPALAAAAARLRGGAEGDGAVRGCGVADEQDAIVVVCRRGRRRQRCR